jgi:hypothetical protein
MRENSSRHCGVFLSQMADAQQLAEEAEHQQLQADGSDNG